MPGLMGAAPAKHTWPRLPVLQGSHIPHLTVQQLPHAICSIICYRPVFMVEIVVFWCYLYLCNVVVLGGTMWYRSLQGLCGSYHGPPRPLRVFTAMPNGAPNDAQAMPVGWSSPRQAYWPTLPVLQGSSQNAHILQYSSTIVLCADLMWYKLVIVVDVVVSRRYIFLHNVVFFFMALFGTDSYRPILCDGCHGPQWSL